MFHTKLKTSLNKSQKFIVSQDEKIFDSAIIAVCLLFLQSLVSASKLDTFQFIALICFSIAIPLNGAHLLVLRTSPYTNVTVPAYLFKLYDGFSVVAAILTAIGVMAVLSRISWIASIAAIATIIYVIVVLRLIGTKKTRLEIEENQKP